MLPVQSYSVTVFMYLLMNQSKTWLPCKVIVLSVLAVVVFVVGRVVV